MCHLDFNFLWISWEYALKVKNNGEMIKVAKKNKKRLFLTDNSDPHTGHSEGRTAASKTMANTHVVGGLYKTAKCGFCGNVWL